MNKLSLLALAAVGISLASCGQGQGPAQSIGGLPPLTTGITVRFDPAPEKTFITLQTEGGEVVYQKPVNAGASSFTPDLNDWRALYPRAAAMPLPSGVMTSPLLFLKWGMFADANSNGKPDEGEWLDRMTHDRVVYAERAVKTDFDTNNPPMHQIWDLNAGWSRAAHYVYTPLIGSQFQRELKTNGLWDFWLHPATPITSM